MAGRRMRQDLPRLKTLGERVRWAREQKDMSQGELANMLDVDQTTISKIEKGEVKNPRNIEEIASALGVPVSWLRFGEENLHKLRPENVEALFDLQALPEADQAAVRALIASLSRK